MTRASWLLVFALALTTPADSFGKTDKPKKAKEDVEQIGERNVGRGINFYSIEKEIALGKQLAQQIERTAKIVDDPVIAEYVNRVGQNLVRNSDAKVPFTIKVIDSEEVNAFALPGGFFYVNTGLIKLAQGEAELAGVMAHEIAHVAARHGTKQASRGQLAQFATIPLIFLGGGWGAYGAQQAASLAIPMTFLKFSRGFEKESDLLGVQYLYKTGYDPTAMVTFFERLQAKEKKKPGTLTKLFRSHPPTGSRIKNIQRAIDELLPDQPQYAISTSEFMEVRTRLIGLTARSRPQSRDPNRPTLKRNPSARTIPGEDDPEADDDERPTLKRRISD